MIDNKNQLWTCSNVTNMFFFFFLLYSNVCLFVFWFFFFYYYSFFTWLLIGALFVSIEIVGKLIRPWWFCYIYNQFMLGHWNSRNLCWFDMISTLRELFTNFMTSLSSGKQRHFNCEAMAWQMPRQTWDLCGAIGIHLVRLVQYCTCVCVCAM